MKTLIAAEWYKLLRGKVLIVILAGTVAQTLVFQILYQLANRPQGPGQGGVMVLANTSLFLQIWMLAFVGYFISTEFQNGTMRNTLALGKNRTHVYLAKLLATFVAIAVICVAVTIVQTVWLTVVNGFGDMSFNKFLSYFALTFSMQLLYHLTFAAVFTLFAFLSRSMGMTLMLGIGYWIVLMNAPAVLSALHMGFAADYSPLHYVATFAALNGQPGFITMGIIVSLGYILISTIIGSIIFNKSDIK